jgi:hypothetical protein
LEVASNFLFWIMHLTWFRALIPWSSKHAYSSILDQCPCLKYLCSVCARMCPSLTDCKQVLFYVLIIRLLLCPIELQHTKGRWGSGFIPIAEYGGEFSKGSIKGKARKAVRLLYSGTNHYDLLV